MRTEQDTQDIDRGHVAIGAAIVLVGLAFLADQADWWHFDVSWRLWPVILLVMGAARMVWPQSGKRHRRSRRGGVWLVMIGAWGLISEFHLFGLHYGTSWPLLIVAAGINMVWRALEEAGPRPVREN
jgi:hypothetical protein